jgi:cytochrome P450
VIAGANETLLRTTNAELIAQLTTRKNAFVKPLKNYAIMKIFGTNILTTEGAEWKRHKRVVGPSFSERSCGLVWQVSLREVEGMMGVWERRERGEKSGEVEMEVLRVEDTSVDTAILSLHVICAAGFGVPQLVSEDVIRFMVWRRTLLTLDASGKARRVKRISRVVCQT